MPKGTDKTFVTKLIQQHKGKTKVRVLGVCIENCCLVPDAMLIVD